MDPTIELLRRDSVQTRDIDTEYDRRFVLNYFNPISFPVVAEKSKGTADLFGDLAIYDALLTARRNYGKMANYERVRLLANPFEGISSEAFLNRAALKMASIHHTFPEILPKTPIIRIGMLAEAPGAMLEYLMWASSLQISSAEVTAISLESGLPWKIDKSSLPGVNNAQLKLLKGKDGTGDLTVPANISSYVDETLRLGERDLVVADGGVDADQQPEKQEYLNAPLILGEVLAALQILTVGGSFVLKLYDAYNRFTADILQLLCRHFRQSTLFKPLTSRPANAERYFVGLGFTGLHIDGKTIHDLYTVLTLSAKALQQHNVKEDITSFLPDPPQIITDFIAGLNDWHAKRQLSFLRWAVTIDEALTSDPHARPNYPISYDLSRFYEIVGIPYVRARVPFELPTSVCQEIRLFDKVGQLARHVAKSLNADEATYGRVLFGWLRYSLAHGVQNLEVLPDLLDVWCDDSRLPDTVVRKALKKLLLRGITYEDIECTALSYQLFVDGDLRFIRAQTVGSTDYDDTVHVSKSVLYEFITQRERGKKNTFLLTQMLDRPAQLERSFTLLRHYETFRLTDDAYKITYPERIDVDLYGTLLTHSAPIFYSPAYHLEASFGAIGIPLDGEDPPMGVTMSLNLLYASETKLRDELITRALRLVAEGRRLYVATFVSLAVLNQSAHRHKEPIVLARDKALNTATGRQLDKHAHLYVLEPIPKGTTVPSEEDPEEEQAEREEKPIITVQKKSQQATLKKKTL